MSVTVPVVAGVSSGSPTWWSSKASTVTVAPWPTRAARPWLPRPKSGQAGPQASRGLPCRASAR